MGSEARVWFTVSRARALAAHVHRVAAAHEPGPAGPSAADPADDRDDVAYGSPREPLLSEETYARAKRILDVTLCLLALPLVFLVLALCAVAIKLDSRGPVFYVQERTGRHGRRFRMFKLRTMESGADRRKDELAALNCLRYPDFKIPEDPRVTRVGRFLRRTSLDEVPQVFNVLRGDMSLVGPRPTSFAPSTYSLWHTARLSVPAGLTGLWQISGRSEVEFDDRLRLDIVYIRNRCLSYDLRILVRTVGAIVRARGAV